MKSIKRRLRAPLFLVCQGLKSVVGLLHDDLLAAQGAPRRPIRVPRDGPVLGRGHGAYIGAVICAHHGAFRAGANDKYHRAFLALSVDGGRRGRSRGPRATVQIKSDMRFVQGRGTNVRRTKVYMKYLCRTCWLRRSASVNSAPSSISSCRDWMRAGLQRNVTV